MGKKSVINKIIISTIVLTCASSLFAQQKLDSEFVDSNSPLLNTPDPIPVQPPKNKVPLGLVNLGTGRFFSPYAIVADKTKRTLTLWQNIDGSLKLVKVFPVDFGRKEGDKYQVDDLRTPEGIYFFQKELSGNSLDFSNYGKRAFTMDYPNFFDRLESKTGYGIWLHAIPDTKTLKRGSRGCVVVRNEAIDELKSYISLQTTPILVKDEVSYITQNEFKEKNQELLTLLNTWKQSWQDKNIDNYISYYHDQFKALHMNKNQWKKYKARLNKQYEKITVNISNAVILKHKSEVIVRFLQSYRSDDHSDFGEKSLYLKSINGAYKIIGEEWKAIPNNTEYLALVKTEEKGS